MQAGIVSGVALDPLGNRRMKSGHCYDFGCCVVCAIATALRIPCVTFPLPSASNCARSSGDMRIVRLIDCPVEGRPTGRFVSVTFPFRQRLSVRSGGR